MAGSPFEDFQNSWVCSRSLWGLWSPTVPYGELLSPSEVIVDFLSPNFIIWATFPNDREKKRLMLWGAGHLSNYGSPSNKVFQQGYWHPSLASGQGASFLKVPSPCVLGMSKTLHKALEHSGGSHFMLPWYFFLLPHSLTCHGFWQLWTAPRPANEN